MLKKENLHPYQNTAFEFVKEKKKCALFLDMGMGKTATSLTAISYLYDDLFLDKTLIIAPLKVSNNVWHKEALNWEHLKHLNIKICTGTPLERLSALNSDADIHVINIENVQWLIEKSSIKWKWDSLICDESTGFKNYASKRFKSLKKILKNLKNVILLTGTPSPNGYMDLWSQIFLIDQGERLGKNITLYRQRFFNKDYTGFNYELKPGAKEEIDELISDICMSMESKDYLQLPEVIPLTRLVDLPDKAKEQYKELKKHFIIDLEHSEDLHKELKNLKKSATFDDNKIKENNDRIKELKKEIQITAASASALENKLLQMCNGAIYDEDKNTHIIHDEKLKDLKEIVEENPGENILVAYHYQSDLLRIKKYFPKAVQLKTAKHEDDWNAGKIKMLIAHPASAGHGLNLQKGGSIIVWFSLTNNLEHYQQFNKRLGRQGGLTKPVRIIHILASNYLDHKKVMPSLQGKALSQQELINYLKFKDTVSK
jgi:superfamily II DNA or RNA helicase